MIKEAATKTEEERGLKIKKKIAAEEELKYGVFFPYSKQQQKAKMPAAGATQALQLFCIPLFAIAM